LLYYRRRGWNEADERLLCALRDRANRRLPLFEKRRTCQP
jgi:hypothetical protein